jgi:hypothetical protein
MARKFVYVARLRVAGLARPYRVWIEAESRSAARVALKREVEALDLHVESCQLQIFGEEERRPLRQVV